MLPTTLAAKRNRLAARSYGKINLVPTRVILMKDLIGKKLGQYQIKAKIGEGGMAAVYKAHQATLNRDVALKILPPSFVAHNRDYIQRFSARSRGNRLLRTSPYFAGV